MEKDDRRQLELFSQPPEGAQHKAAFRDSFFGYIRGYERIILFIIVLIFTGIIFFSLGVEKGKKTVALKIKQEIKNETPVQEKQTVVSEQKASPVNQVHLSQEETGQKTEENFQNYTIQVATFSNKSRAQEEAASLKKKGMTAAVIKKGSYNIVCVGSFAQKDMAKNLLTKLRKQYHDGFIRRL